METRNAKLPDDSVVIWHMFYVDADGNPMALVEMAGGNVRSIPATWVEFLPVQTQNEQNPVFDADDPTPENIKGFTCPHCGDNPMHCYNCSGNSADAPLVNSKKG